MGDAFIACCSVLDVALFCSAVPDTAVQCCAERAVLSCDALSCDALSISMLRVCPAGKEYDTCVCTKPALQKYDVSDCAVIRNV